MKKGSFIITSEMLLWIGRLIFLIVVAFFIFFIVSSYVHREIDIKNLEADILVTRLFYSPNCLVYHDGVKEYPGIIDLNRSKDEIIEDCLHRDGFSAEIILSDLNGNEIAKIFKDGEEFRKNGHIERQRYVLIYDNGDLIQGILKVAMVIK